MSKLAQNNEYAIQTFVEMLVDAITTKRLNYEVELPINSLLLPIERDAYFRDSIKSSFQNTKINSDNILIKSLNEFYITLSCVFRSFGIPTDITKIINSLCYYFREDNNISKKSDPFLEILRNYYFSQNAHPILAMFGRNNYHQDNNYYDNYYEDYYKECNIYIKNNYRDYIKNDIPPEVIANIEERLKYKYY
jgi:hypothetical protein